MNKTIIFIAQQLESGGLEKAVITLANELAERADYNVKLYIVLHSAPIVPISDKICVCFLTSKVLKKEIFIERYFRKIVELYAVKKLIRKINNSVVISSRNEYSTIISKYTDNSNYVIAQLHNDYSLKERRDFIKKYKKINVFVQLNETFKQEIELAIRGKNSFTKIPVIPNFIERRYYEEKSRENYVIAVGGFNKVKGFDRLIEIWKLVCEKNKEWTLIIVGDGKEFMNIKNLVLENKMTETVKITGRLSNGEVFRYMQKSKIYALSSYSEAFPFVALEAMHTKLPIVAFDVRTGPRNIIRNNETGFLVKDGDLVEFAHKLLLLMNNHELWQVMSTASELHSENFLKENVMKKWFGLIDEGFETIRKKN